MPWRSTSATSSAPGSILPWRPQASGSPRWRAFLVHILLLLGFGVAAGTQQDFRSRPRAAVLAGAAALIIIGGPLPRRQRKLGGSGPDPYPAGRSAPDDRCPATVEDRRGGGAAHARPQPGYILCLAACGRGIRRLFLRRDRAVVYLTGWLRRLPPHPRPAVWVRWKQPWPRAHVGRTRFQGWPSSAVLFHCVITFWLPHAARLLLLQLATAQRLPRRRPSEWPRFSWVFSGSIWSTQATTLPPHGWRPENLADFTIANTSAERPPTLQCRTICLSCGKVRQRRPLRN